MSATVAVSPYLDKEQRLYFVVSPEERWIHAAGAFDSFAFPVQQISAEPEHKEDKGQTEGGIGVRLPGQHRLWKRKALMMSSRQQKKKAL